MYFEQSEGRADALFNKLGELTDAGIIRVGRRRIEKSITYLFMIFR